MNKQKIDLNLFAKIVSALMLVIIGCLVLFFPGEALLLVSWLIGIIIIASGIFSILNFVKQRFTYNGEWNLLIGIIKIVFGFIIIFNDSSLLYLTRIFFVVLVLINSIKLIFKSILHRYSSSNWWIEFVIGVILLVVFLIVVNLSTDKFATILSIIMGIGFILLGSYNIIFELFFAKKFEYVKEEKIDTNSRISNSVVCDNCHKKVDKNNVYCPYCGKKIDSKHDYMDGETE